VTVYERLLTGVDLAIGLHPCVHYDWY
jgi:hypothetical protein